MSNEKQEQQSDKLNPAFEKRARIGDPDGIIFIVHRIFNGTTSVESLKVLAQNELGKKTTETGLSVLLLESMNMIVVDGDNIVCLDKLSAHYSDNDEALKDWFADEFIEFVMENDIIDIETISYEIGSDSFLLSPSSIKRKYAGFRNLLANLKIIALRSDARYTILQKLDKYFSKPELRRKITEKQLYAQLQKRKELGNLGEEWVLAYEKRRITNPALSTRIRRISIIDVGAGFDIVSYNSNESAAGMSDRFIEVKTYKGNEHFHWSHNEIEKASLYGEHYYIYLVDADCIDYDDYEPQIIQDPIKNIWKSEEWIKRPDSLLVERIGDRQEHIQETFGNTWNDDAAAQYPTLDIFKASKIELNQTFNYHAPIGQMVAHADKITNKNNE